jgi:hypothetical protein
VNDFTKWDGDLSKLSERAIRGIVEILRRQVALDKAEAQKGTTPLSVSVSRRGVESVQVFPPGRAIRCGLAEVRAL